jgi:hypothetical protein
MVQGAIKVPDLGVQYLYISRLANVSRPEQTGKQPAIPAASANAANSLLNITGR